MKYKICLFKSKKFWVATKSYIYSSICKETGFDMYFLRSLKREYH